MKINRNLAVFLLKVSLLLWIANAIALVAEVEINKLIPLGEFNILIPSLIFITIVFGALEEGGDK